MHTQRVILVVLLLAAGCGGSEASKLVAGCDSTEVNDSSASVGPNLCLYRVWGGRVRRIEAAIDLVVQYRDLSELKQIAIETKQLPITFYDREEFDKSGHSSDEKSILKHLDTEIDKVLQTLTAKPANEQVLAFAVDEIRFRYMLKEGSTDKCRHFLPPKLSSELLRVDPWMAALVQGKDKNYIVRHRTGSLSLLLSSTDLKRILDSLNKVSSKLITEQRIPTSPEDGVEKLRIQALRFLEETIAIKAEILLIVSP